MQFELVFYETGDGQKPVEDFLLPMVLLKRHLKLRAKKFVQRKNVEPITFDEWRVQNENIKAI